MSDTKQWNLPAKLEPVDTDKLSGSQGPAIGDDKSFSFAVIKAWINTFLTPRFQALQDQINILKNLARVVPTYVTPNTTFTGNPGTSGLEIGQTINIVLTSVFHAGDSGGATTQSIKKNGTVVDTDGTYAEANLIIAAAPVNYQSFVDYLQGPIKNDNFGDPYPTGQIMAGQSQSPVLQYKGTYATWTGPLASNPGSSSDIRDNIGLNKVLLGDVQNNILILNTGTTYHKFVVALPDGWVIDNVIDLDAVGVVLTEGYLGQGFTIQDAGGNDVAYRIFVFTQAIAYAASHRHQVTIKVG
jgi:hypothetical protein